jgi:tetratricopeptide (TPR) repeat protein
MMLFHAMVILPLVFNSFDEPSSALKIGDVAFLRIDYPSAITAYEELIQANPNDAELLWRLARVYVCAGEVQENGEGEPYFKKSEQYARRCIRIDSTKVEGHIWLAATLGYRALHAGVKEQVRLTAEMHEEICRVLVLDPNNDAAYSMLGSMFRALGNVSWVQRQLAALFVGTIPSGGFEEGETALKKAIALAPDVMRHQYELGVLYLDWGKKDEGRTVLARARSLPIRVAIDIPRLEKIQALLTHLDDPR